MGAEVRSETQPPLSAGAAALTCRSLSTGYLGHPVLHDVTFSLQEPAIYVVLGPNGAGKTTLFRALAGILRPTHGEVTLGGAPIGDQRSRDQIHFLTHMDGMPDGLTVTEGLRFYARVQGASEADVERVLDQMEIRDLKDRFLSQLSAGQKRRVALGRVFLHERGIYLLDEPTSALDPKVAREIRGLILKLSQQKIVLYSSHNLFEAREIGRYVLVLRDGKLALFDRIENLRGSRFVIGLRLLEPGRDLPGFRRQGEYLLQELSGPEQVPALLADLVQRGERIREVREMGNPLEELFD